MEKQPGKELESLNRYLLIVGGIGAVGLVISLILLSDFKEPIFRIVELMMDGMFGWLR